MSAIKLHYPTAHIIHDTQSFSIFSKNGGNMLTIGVKYRSY